MLQHALTSNAALKSDTWRKGTQKLPYFQEMISAYCITLLSERTRIQHVIEQRALWEGGDFHIVEAIDGRQKEVSEHEGGTTMWPIELVRGRTEQLGMMERMDEPRKACTKGHVKLAQRHVDAIEAGRMSETDVYLVLEDDFAWSAPEALKATLDQVEAGDARASDAIYLGHRGGERRRVKAPTHRAWHRFKARLREDPDAAALDWNEAQRWPGRPRGPLGLKAAGWHLGTHGYLMNGRGARALIETGSSLDLPADPIFQLMQAYGLARFAITPKEFVVTEMELGSTIRSEAEFLNTAKHWPTA